MSKTKYKWWGYIKSVIRSYPDLQKQYDELHEQSVTANTGGLPGSGGLSRGTEDIATRQLPKPLQDELEAVQKAIRVTERMKTGKDRLKLIALVFWKQSHTLQGAAMQVHISYDTAIDYHGDFIMLVAYYHGNATFEELRNHQKIALKSH